MYFLKYYCRSNYVNNNNINLTIRKGDLRDITGIGTCFFFVMKVGF